MSMLQQMVNQAKSAAPPAPPQPLPQAAIVFRPATPLAPTITQEAQYEPLELIECEEIDPPPPCPRCGYLELWEAPTFPSGYRWRCRRCDPPARAEAWLRKAERLRREKELRNGKTERR